MEHIVWLLLSYQVPVNPSKKRVFVWRKLKEIGAVYYRQGVAMLPRTPQNLVAFTTLYEKIISMSGEASLAELKFLNKKDDQLAITEFLRQSRMEYQKIIKEISALYSKQVSSKEELLEKQEKEKKLEKRLMQIKSRDYFMSSNDPEVFGELSNLLKDMSMATDNLTRHISKLLSEK